MTPRTPRRHRRQSGFTLVLALVLLTLIALIVGSAWRMASTNLQEVGNLQARSAVRAAADRALEQVVGSNFQLAPAAQTIEVDIDNNGNADFSVAVATPRCVRAVVASANSPSDVELGTINDPNSWYVDWDLEATVRDPVTGAREVIRQGVRLLMTTPQKTLACPVVQSTT